MPAYRFFYSEPLQKQTGELFLQDEEFQHMLHVVKVREGETIELIDGKGSLAIATVAKIEKKKAVFKMTSFQKEPPPPHSIILAQAIPRHNRLDFIVEKGTELGMTELWLFPGELSELQTFKDSIKLRLEKIAIAATKQCGRLFLPHIYYKEPLHQWTKPTLPLYFGEIEDKPPSLAKIWKPGPGIILCIGPESGFTPKERKKLLSLEGQGIKLHENILRTDTAAITALAQANMLFLD